MKRLRLFTLLTFVLAVGLCACSSDDEQKKEEPLDTQILGTWSVAISGNPGTDELNFTFKKDLTCIMGTLKNKEVISEFVLSCKIDGKNVIMTPRMGDPIDTSILLKVSSINATTMIAKMTYEDGKPLASGLSPDADYTFTKALK